MSIISQDKENCTTKKLEIAQVLKTIFFGFFPYFQGFFFKKNDTYFSDGWLNHLDPHVRYYIKIYIYIDL